jgi:hypothetical protein
VPPPGDHRRGSPDNPASCERRSWGTWATFAAAG